MVAQSAMVLVFVLCAQNKTTVMVYCLRLVPKIVAL